MTPAPLLALRGIVKAFPGVRALDGVDFTLRAGEIHALLGENGAGKSTLIKVLTGVHEADAGEILMEGRPIRPRSPMEAQRLGISAVYQEINLVPDLSVAENLLLGRPPMRFGMIDWRGMNRRAEEAVARLGIRLNVRRRLGDLSPALQQMTALARALQIQARVLVLDEPTSSLDAAEVRQLFEVMRRLKAEGLGIVFISHFLDQVYATADRLTVLRNGKLVGEYEAARLGRLELVALMLGRDVEEVRRMEQRHAPAAARAERAPLLRAEGIGRRGGIGPVDLSVRAGEVVGLAGLLGSGRTETARLLFGIDRARQGRLLIDDRPVTLGSPRAAIARGLGFCPEDRKTDGIVPGLSVRENLVLALQARHGAWRRLTRARQDALVERFVRALGIATPDADKPVEQLSGGNQQKVLLARWLAAEPRLLILDEPTRGIDVGAKAEIEKLVAQLSADGMAILFISSELEEVARGCHRVVVLRDGRSIGELAGDQIQVERIVGMIAS
jgi:simple sugar transport system ATP-binding protein